MPVAWLKRRSARALLLFFPWFPGLSLSPSETESSTAAVEAAVSQPEAVVLPRVVIEKIPKGSALEKAGLQVGDVISSWERLPSPPANPEAASGELTSYFDWLELEVEQVPRGVVVLRGWRGGESLEIKVEPGLWEAPVRPVLSRALEETYLTGKAEFAAGDLEAAVGAWRSLTDGAVSEDRGDISAWVALRIGGAWAERVEWEKAATAYREALGVSGKNRLIQIAAWEALCKAHERRNEYEKAEKACASALEIRRKWRPGSLGIATSLNSLGELAYTRGELGRALDYHLQGLKIREQLAPHSLQFASSLDNLGIIAWNLGEFDRAQDYHSRALKIYQQLAPHSLSLAYNLINLGNVHWAHGDLELSRNFFSRALEIQMDLAPHSLDVATSLNQLGIVAQVRGDLEIARDFHRRALQIREELAPESPDVAQSLGNLGMVAFAYGALDQARDYFLKAQRIDQRLAPQSLSVAQDLGALGTVAQTSGALDLAFDYQSQALRIQQRLAPQSLDVANSLVSLGIILATRGELDRAQEYLLRAQHVQELIAPDSIEAANNLTNLGGVALERGELDRSEEYHRRALKLHVKLAPESLLEAYSLHNLGVVAERRGDLGHAENLLLRALRIRKRLAPGSLVMAASLLSLGTVAQARGNVLRAEDYFLQALQVYDQLGSRSLELAANLNHLGNVASVRKEPGLAHEYYSRALSALEYQVSRLGAPYDVQAGYRARYGDYYRDMLSLLLMQGRFFEAFETLERSRAQTFLAMLAERDLAFTADIPEELDRERRRLRVRNDHTLKRLAEFKSSDHGEDIEAIRKELQRLNDEAGDIETRIRKASPRLAALKYPHSLEVTEVRQALDQGTVLLSYSVGKEKTVLFALSNAGDLEVKTLPLGEEEIRSRVKQLLGLIRESVQGSSLGELRQRRVQAASRELYAALLGPVAERIAASERLLILPDGPLHALPFAALVRDSGAGTEQGHRQYLAEWKPLHVALSATVFAELRQRRRPAIESDTGEAPIQLAAFGAPIYPQSLTKAKGDSASSLPAAGVIAQIDDPHGDPVVRSAADRGIFDWPPLPYTRHEVEGIASLFPAGTARTFLGPEALEDRIKSLDPKTRILHLAAHGYTNEHLASSSFVALTIPEDTSFDAATPEHDNGLLQVWEIFERVRLEADLVVLSACDTALGEEQGGEGLIGLTRAFQYAGARTVMASLWSVRDQATSELMIRFYKHLRAALPKDQALQAAQQELLRGPIEVINEKGEPEIRDFSAPYYWAGFQLYGDWE